MDEWTEIYEIRYQNFLLVVKEHGSIAKLVNAKPELNPSHLSQINTKRRPIGERFARTFEHLAGKPKGWMDTRARTPEETALVALYWKLPETVRPEMLSLFRALSEHEMGMQQRISASEQEK